MKFEKLVEDQQTHNNLLICDGTNLSFRYIWKGNSNFAGEYINTVESLANSYRANKIIVLFDWGASKYRKDIDENYKANREEKRKKQSEEDAEKFKLHFEELNNVELLLKSKGYAVIKVKNVEADDVAAYIVDNYSNKFELTTLISSDRDWSLMLSDSVQQFSYVNRKEYTINNWNEHHPFSHDQFLDYKVLTGDKSDNIEGVPGIATKRAESILADYYSLYDIDFPIKSNLKYIQNLNIFQASGKIEKGYKLMDLLTYYREAIGEENLDYLKNILNDYLLGENNAD